MTLPGPSVSTLLPQPQSSIAAKPVAALIVPELKTVPLPLHENADVAARADIDRSGVDDGIAAAETADVDADGGAGSDGDGAAVGDGVGIAEHENADGMVAEQDAAAVVDRSGRADVGDAGASDAAIDGAGMGDQGAIALRGDTGRVVARR